jgi:hypothetical protein
MQTVQNGLEERTGSPPLPVWESTDKSLLASLTIERELYWTNNLFY